MKDSNPVSQTTEMPLSDANDLDAVVHALGIEDSDTTPAEAVAVLHAEIEQLRASTLRPMSEAPHVDGHEILAWEKSRWGAPARWRVIHWSEGPHHICYNRCWVCSVCTLSSPEDWYAGWLPMPADPTGV